VGGLDFDILFESILAVVDIFHHDPTLDLRQNVDEETLEVYTFGNSKVRQPRDIYLRE
jgi:hypothetical protein